MPHPGALLAAPGGPDARSIEVMEHHVRSVGPATPQRQAVERRGLGIPMGSLFGVPLRMNSTWLLLAALLTYAFGRLVLDSSGPALPAAVGYGIGFGFVLCLLGSVLLHELGHALTSLRFGIGVRGITLEALGGYTEMDREAPRPAVDLYVSLAGPVVSLVLGLCWGAVSLLLPVGSLGHQLAAQVAYVNIVIAGFNALPGLPLDGGRALQAVVWAVTGDRHRGQRVAGWFGRAIAVVGLAVAFGMYRQQQLSVVGLVVLVLVVVSVWNGAGQALRTLRLEDKVGGLDTARLIRPIVGVSQGTSLAAAWSQVQQSGSVDPTVAVADPYGQVVGLLHTQAAAAVPAERRESITVDALARTLQPDHVVTAGLRGLDLLQAVGWDPTADYLVVKDEDVLGVLRGADITALLESEGLVSRRTTR